VRERELLVNELNTCSQWICVGSCILEVHRYLSRTHKHRRLYSALQTQTKIKTHQNTRTHTHTHTYMHTHTHTHTHVHTQYQRMYTYLDGSRASKRVIHPSRPPKGCVHVYVYMYVYIYTIQVCICMEIHILT